VSDAPLPTPRPLGAVVLTAFAWSVLVLVTALATPAAGGTLGLALGMLLGFGGAGTLAARAMPPPAEVRIGLGGFAPRLLLPLVLLLPVVLLLSELDNQIATHLFDGAKPPAPERELGPLETLEWVLFGVLLRPVLEEFFFRGVVQQGVVSALGAGGGLLLTAVLFALVRTSLFADDAYHATSFGLQAFGLGVLLGFVRLASGSILASMLVLCGIEALGALALVLREELPIPGFNVGAHTPLEWLTSAALSVAAGAALLARHADGERRSARGASRERPLRDG
jgi:membrane protease YdiL (CAAX protease family)